MRLLALVALAAVLGGCAADEAPQAPDSTPTPTPTDNGPLVGAMPGGLGATAGDAPGGNLTAGQDHFCTLFDDGTVKCWGANDAGDLDADPPIDQ